MLFSLFFMSSIPVLGEVYTVYYCGEIHEKTPGVIRATVLITELLCGSIGIPIN